MPGKRSYTARQYRIGAQRAINVFLRTVDLLKLTPEETVAVLQEYRERLSSISPELNFLDRAMSEALLIVAATHQVPLVFTAITPLPEPLPSADQPDQQKHTHAACHR
jgi:hypothetical protein